MKKLNIRCDRCGSDDIVKHGIKGTVGKGKRQRYQCKSCYKTFYAKEEKDK